MYRVQPCIGYHRVKTLEGEANMEQTLEEQAQAWLKRREEVSEGTTRLLKNSGIWSSPKTTVISPTFLPEPLKTEVLRQMNISGTRKNPPGTERPYDVSLSDLEGLLRATNLKVTRVDSGLVIEHPKFVTRVNVLAPPASAKDPIQAIVEVRSTLPAALRPVFEQCGEGAIFNSLATLGAITRIGDQYVVASRLTIFEQEDAWNIQLPLLSSVVIGATESLLGAIHRSLGGTGIERERTSKWTTRDLMDVEDTLSKFSFCRSNGSELTAEFGLVPGHVRAEAGHQTALWELRADEPHTEMGGGLFCLLRMPVRFDNEARLHEVCAELNRLEMIPGDQPPHFGAWCPGNSGRLLAYVSFLPNTLHMVPGIATNFSIWAMHRAVWAHQVLKELESPPPRSTVREPMPARPPPSANVAPAVQRSSSGRTDREMVDTTRGVVGAGLSDDKLLALAKMIDGKLVGRPKALSSKDIEEIVKTIYGLHRSILYSELERLVEALHRPVKVNVEKTVTQQAQEWIQKERDEIASRSRFFKETGMMVSYKLTDFGLSALPAAVQAEILRLQSRQK